MKNQIIQSPQMKRIFMSSESEPVREPTDHRCEQCGKVFAKAEDLNNHYNSEHAE
jgi:hypothetical protein